MIEFATKQGAKVKNDKGELVKVAQDYPDAVKCYSSFPYYYLSSAEKQEGLTFDGLTYDEWKEKPIELS